MDSIFALVSVSEFLFALGIAVLAGFVKGVVGFAMPLVLISGLTTFMSPELALAGLILPTLVSNAMQALRQGFGAAWESIVRFRVFLLVGGITLFASAQMVRLVSDRAMLLIIGTPVVLFALLQLSGYRFKGVRKTLALEASVGGFAGLIGGVSGIWGPPTVAYLTALETAKRDQMRIQGVIYGLGAVALMGAHIGSGVLRAETAPFSATLVIPAALGMWIGGLVSDRFDQDTFRRATLFVLLLAGLNLLRRAFF